MGSEEVQAMLEEALGSEHVYFQPPSNVRMEYPAIVFFRSGQKKLQANNGNYIMRWTWSVTHISRDPESPVLKRLSAIRGMRYNRPYVADNLYHDNYTLTTL